MKKTKRRLKKWVIVVLLLILLSLLVLLYKFFFLENNNINTVNNKTKEKVEKLREYAITNKKVSLYLKKAKKYKKIGEVNENVILHLTNDKNNYYKIRGLDDDYYIKGDDLVDYNGDIKIDDRYNNYIVFNKNIKTTDNTSFYDESGNLVYSINKSMSLPIVIMDKSMVGVIYNDRILYVKIDGNSSIVSNNNTTDENIEGIGVLNYHFFYDDSKEGEVNKCSQDICMSFSNLKKQLSYIKDNDYFTPTMTEFEMYIDGKIQLPKSVVITIDDGWRAIDGINIINDYKLNATIFVITGSYDPNDFKREYVEVHSHSDNMHDVGVCPLGQGGGIQCLPREKILDDLKKSSEKLGGSKIFCYPFYEYNDYSISVLKEAGYTMAFAGEFSGKNNMTTPETNKYAIPRFVMVNYTTIDDLSKYLKGQYYS